MKIQDFSVYFDAIFIQIKLPFKLLKYWILWIFTLVRHNVEFLLISGISPAKSVITIIGRRAPFWRSLKKLLTSIKCFDFSYCYNWQFLNIRKKCLIWIFAPKFKYFFCYQKFAFSRLNYHIYCLMLNEFLQKM